MVSARTLAAEALRQRDLIQSRIDSGDLPEGIGGAVLQFSKDSYHFANACVGKETATQDLLDEVYRTLCSISGSEDCDHINRVVSDRTLLDRMCAAQMAVSSGTLIV